MAPVRPPAGSHPFGLPGTAFAGFFNYRTDPYADVLQQLNELAQTQPPPTRNMLAREACQLLVLLSDLPIRTAAEAWERGQWYCRRWTIEEWHRVLKSGCGVGQREFETAETLQRALAFDLIVAWRVLACVRWIVSPIRLALTWIGSGRRHGAKPGFAQPSTRSGSGSRLSSFRSTTCTR